MHTDPTRRRPFMVRVLDYLRWSWKTILVLAIPIGWEALIQLLEGLQGSFADNTVVVAVITAIAVWFKSNRPLPGATPLPDEWEEDRD